MADFGDAKFKLTEAEALYVLEEALNGYEILNDKCISAFPSAKMIALNNLAEVKVWICENFGSNAIFRHGTTESSVVKEIFLAVF